MLYNIIILSKVNIDFKIKYNKIIVQNYISLLSKKPMTDAIGL